jgi:hypothetical protein
LPLRFSASPTGPKVKGKVEIKNNVNAALRRFALAFDLPPLRRRRGAQVKREQSGPDV